MIKLVDRDKDGKPIPNSAGERMEAAILDCNVHVGAKREQVRRVLIANEFLCDLLRFPPGTKIVGYNIECAWRECEPDLELMVCSPDFSPVLPGTEISVVCPQYRLISSPVASIEFVSWDR